MRRILSLFSGCGGMDIGFTGGFWSLPCNINECLHPDWIQASTTFSYDEKTVIRQVFLRPTGFEIIFANDILLPAMLAYNHYFSRDENYDKNIYHLGSIVDLVKAENAGCNIFPKNVDMVIGGFPCCDFSVAGKRKGFRSQTDHLGKCTTPDTPTEETRGSLYIWMRDVITVVQPKMFVAENVKGLVNLGEAKDIIASDFASAGEHGYLVVQPKVLLATEYGVPQTRERVFFIGFRRDALLSEAEKELQKENILEKYDPYPPKTHGSGKKKIVTATEAFAGLGEPNGSLDASHRAYSKAKYMGKHCQGQTEIRLDAPAPTIRAEHHGNIEFRRLSEEHGGTHAEELRAGLPERRLTVRECARIQTFPDDYEFVLQKEGKNPAVSASSAYKIIGNAVPPILAYNIAENLAEKWEKYFGKDEKKIKKSCTKKEKHRIFRHIRERV